MSGAEITVSKIWIVFDHLHVYYTVSKIQVAALAPLALLPVLEARCAHFVIVHFKNFFVL